MSWMWSCCRSPSPVNISYLVVQRCWDESWDAERSGEACARQKARCHCGRWPSPWPELHAPLDAENDKRQSKTLTLAETRCVHFQYSALLKLKNKYRYVQNLLKACLNENIKLLRCKSYYRTTEWRKDTEINLMSNNGKTSERHAYELILFQHKNLLKRK